MASPKIIKTPPELAKEMDTYCRKQGVQTPYIKKGDKTTCYICISGPYCIQVKFLPDNTVTCTLYDGQTQTFDAELGFAEEHHYPATIDRIFDDYQDTRSFVYRKYCSI